MDAVMVMGALIAVAIASGLWGHDSRETIRSKEEELAAYGVSWLDLENADAHACDASRPLTLATDSATGHRNGVHAP